MLDKMPSLDAVLSTLQSVAGIGGIIFVHELGHFLVGRLCGVKAEAFSIGFGPVILKWQPGETEYRLSIIPLGGYVKFLGENPDERTDESPRSFEAATYPRKVAILLAGVAMNVLAAFVLFAIVFSSGWEAKAPVVGVVQPGSPAWENGIRPGDEIVEMNSHRILDFQDVTQESIFHDAVAIKLKRDGKLLTFSVATRENEDGLRQIGIGAGDDGVLRIDAAASAAPLAGDLRDGDRVVAVDGAPVPNVQGAIRAAGDVRRDTVWTVERGGARVDVAVAWRSPSSPRIGVELGSNRVAVRGDGPAHAAGLRTGDEPVSVGGRATPTSTTFTAALGDASLAGDAVVRRAGVEVTAARPADAAARKAFAASVATLPQPGQLWVSLPEGEGPARGAGLPECFHVLEADGRPVQWQGDLAAAVRDAWPARKAITLRWAAPSGAEGTTEVTPAELPGTTLDLGPVDVRFATRIVREPDLFAAMGLGVERTARWVERIGRTLTSIASGRVSGTKLSGPIGIAVGTYSQAKQSWADFLLFLAMISMNLAVLNVLPVPLLDGGQLLVKTIERLRGRPLSETVLSRVQWTGLVLLLSLMVYVIKNDIVNLVRS